MPLFGSRQPILRLTYFRFGIILVRYIILRAQPRVQGVFMKEQLDAIKRQALDEIATAQTSADMAAVRVKYLGKAAKYPCL